MECEWPMFYINIVLNAMFSGNHDMVETYWSKLQKLVLPDTNGSKKYLPANKLVRIYSRAYSNKILNF